MYELTPARSQAWQASLLAQRLDEVAPWHASWATLIAKTNSDMPETMHSGSMAQRGTVSVITSKYIASEIAKNRRHLKTWLAGAVFGRPRSRNHSSTRRRISR